MLWSYLAAPGRIFDPFVEGPRGFLAFDLRPVRPLPAPCTPSPDGDVGTPWTISISSFDPSFDDRPR